MADKKAKKTVMMTPTFRVSFAKLFTPEAYGEGDPKYSVTAIVDTAKIKKDLTEGTAAEKAAAERDKQRLTALIKYAESVGIEKFGKAEFEKMRRLNQFKWPFRDGEEKELDGYGPGKIFFTLSTWTPPGVVGRDGRTRLTEEEMYSGCYAHATVFCKAFDNKSKGVSFRLNNIQKLGEGPRFSGATLPEEDFEEVDDDYFADTYVEEAGLGATTEGPNGDLF